MNIYRYYRLGEQFVEFYTIDKSNNNGIIEICGSKIGQLLNTNFIKHMIMLLMVHIQMYYHFDTISISGDNGYSIV